MQFLVFNFIGRVNKFVSHQGKTSNGKNGGTQVSCTEDFCSLCSSNSIFGAWLVFEFSLKIYNRNIQSTNLFIFFRWRHLDVIDHWQHWTENVKKSTLVSAVYGAQLFQEGMRTRLPRFLGKRKPDNQKYISEVLPSWGRDLRAFFNLDEFLLVSQSRRVSGNSQKVTVENHELNIDLSPKDPLLIGWKGK